MVDERFFTPATPLTLDAVAALVEGEILSRQCDALIKAAAPLHSAEKGHVSFVKERTHLSSLQKESGAVILTTNELAKDVVGASAVIVVKNPRAAFAIISKALITETSSISDQRQSASIDKTANVHETAIISAFCVIGSNVVVGAGTILEPGVHIGAGVHIGDNCSIGSHAHLQMCIIGDDTSIGPQTVIGKAGFGFEMTEAGAVSIPHIGRVIVGSHVSIGANCTIDRGVMDDTRLADAVMIDNLVHIAHNVDIGARCIILAQTGIAGSTIIGADCIIAAQVGIKDHVEIAPKSVILSRSAVTKSLTKPGVYAGFPAQPSKDEWRDQARLKKLVKEKFGKGIRDD